MRLLLSLSLLAGCGSSDDPEVVENTVTNTVTNTVHHTNTHTNTHTITETGVEGGHFSEPLTMLAQVLDDDGAIGPNGPYSTHMHIAEARYRALDQKMVYCSYTFGVVDASDPVDPEYAAQGYDWDLGSPVGRDTGCLHLDWDDADPDIIYVSHRGNYDFQPHLSVVDLNTSYEPDDYDLEDPFYDPVLAPSLREPDISYEGLDAENGLVYVALHVDGIGVYQRNPADNTMVRVGGDASIVSNAYDIEVVGTTAYVLDEHLGLFVLDVTDPTAITELGHVFLGGIDRDIRVDGDYAYIAAGAAGLVVVDISNPSKPAVVSMTSTHGTAIRVGYDADKVAVAAWNDIRVFDVADRAAPQIVGAVRFELDKEFVGDDSNERPDITARNLAVDLHGDLLFAANWWTPFTYRIHEERVAPYIVLPEEVHYVGMGTVAVGDTSTHALRVRNDGTAPLTVTDIWATNEAFSADPSSLVVPPGGEAFVNLTYTATTDEEETAILKIVSDDPSQPVREGYLVGNAEGIGVGDPFPFTEGFDAHDLSAWTSDDFAGQVTLISYFATFCPVCANHVPDVGDQFYDTYKDEGLYVVAIDADSDDHDNPAAVADFVDNVGVTFPVKLEESTVTPTYATIEGIHDGANPFPVDILVDKNGIIRYIAREYDPLEMHAKVQELLAE